MSPAAAAVRYQLEETDLLQRLGSRARRQTRYIEDAEDLLQNTVLLALEKADSLRKIELARAWIWGIYDNFLLEYVEKRMWRRARVDEAAIPDTLRAPSDIEGELIVRLRPNEKMILTQFYGLGRSKEEIRAEMNLTETQFRLLKYRAKAQLAAFCHGKTERIRF
jgi:DNA-directed RNA polymerase specialized sigma24 family protein